MNTQLRNIAALVDFECAARWCSFKLAAHEMHKTPAAVSQNIRQLEQALGFALFERHARHLTITEKGADLAVTVSQMLKDLHIKVRALREDGDSQRLRISCTHSFAMKWLIPRIHGFTEKYPHVDIQVESSDAVVDLVHGACDIAIRYQLLRECDTDQLLWHEQLVPAYNSALLSGKDKLAHPVSLKRLLRYPLLFEGTPENWIRFLQAQGMLDMKPDFAQNYSHSGLLVQAAVAAQGVALLPYAIAYEDMQQGRLQAIPGVQMRSRYCYRLLTAPDKATVSRVVCFTEWLREEIEIMRAAVES